MADSLPYFEKLGRRVDREWRATNYDEHALPAIAEAALLEMPAHRALSPWDVARWMGREPKVEQNPRAAFGQPPLTVYLSPHFYIEVLYWLDSSTAIHRHAFSGAFSVFEGSSIHTTYTFEPDTRVNDTLHFGRLEFHDSERLEKAEVRRIALGDRFIHSLFHLDHPSVSLVVRTPFLKSAQPQFKYLPPGLAVDPFFEEPNVAKALQVVDMLLKLNRRREAKGIAIEMVTTRDLRTVFSVLDSLIKLTDEPGRRLYHRVLAAARKRHGALVDRLAEALRDDTVRERFKQARARVTDSELRFFMAMLLNIPSGDRIHEMVRERWPGEDSAERIIRWSEELQRLQVIPYRFDDVQAQVFRLMVRSTSLDGILEAFRREYGSDEVERSKEGLETVQQQLRASPYVGMLFA